MLSQTYEMSYILLIGSELRFTGMLLKIQQVHPGIQSDVDAKQ